MEQRISPNLPPVNAAADDPASVPGLLPTGGPGVRKGGDTPSRPGRDPDTEPDTAAGDGLDEEARDAGRADGPEDAGAAGQDVADADSPDSDGQDADGTPGPAGAGGGGAADREATGADEKPPEAAEDASASAEGAEGATGHGTDESGDGSARPVFEAADRRGSVSAGPQGVRFRLDDQEAAFGWEEIAAVEHSVSLSGRWFSVTVHTPDRRWYEADVQAGRRKQTGQWRQELEAALDAYFEE